jgi:DNA repair exonuclease SbcCD ATPase subunit|tara:strand:- start:2987 stop:4786 length:1800 start_codon:yes stop_codon:yes gene_type:complete
MIILKTLKWNNCFSYGENNSLDLSSAQLTQILGVNGVGKSSIPLILEEILFNKNSKGIKKADIPNRELNVGYSISLNFTKSSDEYEIDLQRKSNLKVKFTKNGEDISSHTATNTYKSIEEVLGIDFKTFSQVVYQNTNASLNFLTATDANRKKFLIDLLGLEKYVKLFDIFKEASREVEHEYANLEGRISTVEKWLENNKLTDTTPQELVELPKISEADEEEHSSLTTEIKNIASTNRKIFQNNQFKSLLKEINIQEIQAIEASEHISYDELQAQLGAIAGSISSGEKAIRKMENLENVCPTCEQPITEDFKTKHISQEQEKVQTRKDEHLNIQKEIKEIQKNNESFVLKSKKQQEWEELYRSVDNDMPTVLVDEEVLKIRITDIRTTIAHQKNQIDLLQRENNVRSAFNAKIEVITEQTADFEKQLAEVVNRYKVLGVKRGNLEILKKAFSTNGLIAYKIENLVKELEELTSEYLAELSDGRFTLNFAVNNDKLNVEVTDHGKIIDILALSSGELARVNTATLLAIRKLMNSLSSSQINVLFLDEVMTVLDETGKEKLVEVLLEENLNTYLVNHGWSHPLLEKIEVIKDPRNISRLVA